MAELLRRVSRNLDEGITKMKQTVGARPTTGKKIIITSGPHRGRAGRIVADNKQSDNPYDVKDWDGQIISRVGKDDVKLATRIELISAQKQAPVNPRPTTGKRVITTSNAEGRRAGPIIEDKDTEPKPFKIMDWNGTVFGPVAPEVVQNATRVQMVQAQIKSSSRRPTTGSSVIVVKGSKYEGLAGFVERDDMESDACYQIEHWDGTLFGPLRADEVFNATPHEMAEVQRRGDKKIGGRTYVRRPVAGNYIKVEGGPRTELTGRAGEVHSDDPSSRSAPFKIYDWDKSVIGPISGKSVKHCGRAEMSELQIRSSNRPTTKALVKVKQGKMKGRAGEIVTDNVSAAEPFTLQTWDGSTFPASCEAHFVEMVSREQMANIQISDGKNPRPTTKALVEIKGKRDARTLAGRAGEILEDNKSSVTPFSLKGWDGEKLPGTCRTDEATLITRSAMAAKQIRDDRRPTKDSLVKVVEKGHKYFGRAGKVANDNPDAFAAYQLFDVRTRHGHTRACDAQLSRRRDRTVRRTDARVLTACSVGRGGLP